MVALLVLSGVFSAFFIYKLLSGGRSKFEKFVYCVVLLVPFLGPLLYLFLSEEVPPQPPILRNNGPRGSYTDAMIAIGENMKELARLEAERKTRKDEANVKKDDEVGP